VSNGDPLSFRKLAAKLKDQSSPRQVVMLLDEVDELLDFDSKAEPGGQLFKTFRALSHEGVCRFVFSGSCTLYRQLHNPRSPFFNFCEDLTLRPLEEKSIAEIISKPMRQLGIELPDEDLLIRRMIDLTSSHPNIAQWLCDRLIKTISVRRITVSELEAAAAGPGFSDHYVTTAWGEASPLERLISLVMEGPVFSLEELCERLAGHGITDKAAIRDALEMLQLYSLLDREGRQYRLLLANFPRLVRQVEDVPSQIEALVGRVEA